MRGSVGFAVGGAILALTAGAQAIQVSYGFGAITSNGSSAFASSFNSQLTVTVSNENTGNGVPGANQVDFIFRNAVGLASSITDVYFDDGTLLGIASIFESAGVDYAQNASPGNLPGGAGIGFVTTVGFSADSQPPTLANGVSAAGESLTIRFNLIAGQTIAHVLAALNGGSDLRIGIHVQGQGQESNSYVTTTLIPLPMGAWAGAAGLAGLGAMGWLRRRSLRA